jgi:hypothetical protein
MMIDLQTLHNSQQLAYALGSLLVFCSVLSQSV